MEISHFPEFPSGSLRLSPPARRRRDPYIPFLNSSDNTYCSGNNSYTYRTSYICRRTLSPWVTTRPSASRSESAVAFARFARRLSDYPAKSLYEIIPDFHNTKKRMEDFKGRDTKNSSALTTGDLFKYSIADLLNDVKSEFDDTFSEDVYTHLNMKRRQTEHFSDHLQYSRGEGYDPYKEYKYPSYAMMPEFGEPLNVNYTGEGYTAENGLKLFTKYSVDTARDFIMGELMLSEGKISLAKDLNEFYTFIIQIRGTHTINQKQIR